MNKVLVIGRLTADPIVKISANGSNIVSFTIASRDNMNKEKSYFFPVTVFNNPANFVAKYIKKADYVAVDGRLTKRSYVDKDGKTVFITEIVADSVNSLSSSKNEQSQNNPILENAFSELKKSSPIKSNEEDEELSFLDEENKN
ncbi:MAG: single-stranded DNA-binding protein [Mycoplasmataceae bacterium]|jgi:single-strand DNA-binding protein|nr:single-stranded DNA-binding protein [Mycoplasmataceae bacterium]